jgi:hypothetical protein
MWKVVQGVKLPKKVLYFLAVALILISRLRDGPNQYRELVWLRYCYHQVCQPFAGYVLVLLCMQQTNKGLCSWLYVVAHITLLWLWLFFPSIDLCRCLVCWKSISSGTQYVTLKKMFLTSKSSYLLFSNLTHKTQNWTANRWETTNSKPPRPIIMIGRSVTGSSSQIIFVTLFSGRC